MVDHLPPLFETILFIYNFDCKVNHRIGGFRPKYSTVHCCNLIVVSSLCTVLRLGPKWNGMNQLFFFELLHDDDLSTNTIAQAAARYVHIPVLSRGNMT